MKFETTSIGGSVEILASKDFQAIPVTVAAPSEGTVVKAGTPLDAEGTSSGTLVGILLYDVDTAENPNGALVVHGIIDKAKAEAHSGVSLNSVSIPGIVLRGNIRALGADASLSALTIGSLVLAPAFDSDTVAYTATTANGSDVVNATTTDANATVAIKVGDTTVANGSAASWASGANTLTVTVTAENGASKVYTVVVTRS